MKKLFAFITILCLLAAGGVFSAYAESEGTAPAPVTADELAAWAGALKDAALKSSPVNDPAHETAEREDGTLFLYDFGALYAEGTEMTAETAISVIEITEMDDAVFRGLTISMTPGEAAALFPNDNPDMAGDRESALLYRTEDAENGVLYGLVHRDGQRISAIEYGHVAPAEGEYKLARIICLFTEGLLYEIRVEGFGETRLISEEERDAFIAELEAAAGKDEYRAVRSSRDGTELTAFGAEDLVFSGIDFLNLQPEDLPGTPETNLFDNEDGTWILTADEADYEAVFQCGADGRNAAIVSFTIKGENMEGPRCVRLGDAYHEDMQRFRFESRDDGGDVVVLYGGEDTLPRGTVQYYGDDGITLRYATEVPGGRTAELLMRYTLSRLSEIIIYVK